MLLCYSSLGGTSKCLDWDSDYWAEWSGTDWSKCYDGYSFDMATSTCVACSFQDQFTLDWSGWTYNSMTNSKII